MSQLRQFARRSERGFTMIELLIVAAILLIIMAPIFRSIQQMTKRNQAEQVKVDLSQQAREFVDEFERDLHQAGYPSCHQIYNSGLSCSTLFNNASVAAGLVYVSSTEIIFEGDTNGDGAVESIRYRIVDQAGNYPPSTTCPCTLQRSEVTKVGTLTSYLGTSLLNYPQGTNWSQELQNVVNSGVPGLGSAYGGGLNIAGNTPWNPSLTNTAYYAAVATFKDFPVFTPYDQSGLASFTLPLDMSSATSQFNLTQVRSIRLTINLLGSQTSGMDIDTKTRPVETLVGTGRLVNNTF
jgi:prepilin-type N-terminal cleavage/methylation domain-containing protein